MADLRLPDLNKAIIAGRLTRNPVVRYITSGKAVCDLSVANSRHYKNAQGEKVEDTTFVDVTVWDKSGEWCGENLSKGDPVLIEGALKSDSWEDKTTGAKRSKLQINAQRVAPLAWKDDAAQAPAARTAPAAAPAPQEDIPF